MVPVEPLTKDGLLTSGKRSVREKIHTKPPWLMGGWSWFPLSRDDSPLNQGKKSSTTPIDLETEKTLYRIPTNPFFRKKHQQKLSDLRSVLATLEGLQVSGCGAPQPRGCEDVHWSVGPKAAENEEPNGEGDRRKHAILKAGAWLKMYKAVCHVVELHGIFLGS